MNTNKNWELYSKAVKRAWKDPEYKKKLLSDPTQTLKEAGLEIGSSETYKIIENHGRKKYLVLPKKPSVEIDESALNVSAGSCSSECCCSPCSC